MSKFTRVGRENFGLTGQEKSAREEDRRNQDKVQLRNLHAKLVSEGKNPDYILTKEDIEAAAKQNICNPFQTIINHFNRSSLSYILKSANLPNNYKEE